MSDYSSLLLGLGVVLFLIAGVGSWLLRKPLQTQTTAGRTVPKMQSQQHTAQRPPVQQRPAQQAATPPAQTRAYVVQEDAIARALRRQRQYYQRKVRQQQRDQLAVLLALLLLCKPR